MMGLRADTTPQVARIATTRLATAPRPLRLSYAGQCLRVRGNQLAPDRQVAQAGIELIGHDSPEADAETVLVAAEALAALGLTRVSFDLTLPMLVPSLLDDAGHRRRPTRRRWPRALDRKDAAAVARHGGPLAPVLTELLLAAGPADRALAALARRATARPCGHAGRARGADCRRHPRRRAGAAADRRSGRIPRLPLRNRRLGHGLRAGPARGAGPRRTLSLRRGRAGDRPDPVPRRVLRAAPAAPGASARFPAVRRRSDVAAALGRRVRHRRGAGGARRR